ncbi:CAP-associated domain-containing protein [Paenibacillus sp. GCM10012307]|uniref:S-layer homology domain-containing protein n=1 Tax=Paenibacillus roseus TaxID=2798579 RepID=A0A934J6U0_9BACL|nr:CAP-associated domain-containing protein [Paenibacillus roseus]MBJ6361445.1 S-layer homology domain-containing protein [Paenibacillus roseus]
MIVSKPQFKRRFRTVASSAILLALATGVVPTYAYADNGVQFADLPPTHWAYKTIRWAQENQIVTGYQDGTFRPNQAVSEPEFLAMLLRAYPEVSIAKPAGGSPWYSAYYEAAAQLGWPVAGANTAYTRGEVARLLAAVQGESLSVNDSIQFVMKQGLANGKTTNTIEGFKAADSLSRAEAQTFIFRLKELQPKLKQSGNTAPEWTLNGIQIGDTEEHVLATLGQPDRKDASGYDFQWYVYNKNYNRFAQIGIKQGTVVALYSNASGWNPASKAAVGTQRNNIADDSIGKPVIQDSKQRWTTYTGSVYETTLFFDTLDGYKVDAILLLKSGLKAHDYSEGNVPQQELLRAYERGLLDLTNVIRTRKGLKPLLWNDKVSDVARAYSTDMGTRNFFNHTSPDGDSVRERFTKAELMKSASSFGENIAAGYENAFYAHAGWINSQGHRDNLLREGYKELGIGAAFVQNSEYGFYYTQNFASFR